MTDHGPPNAEAASLHFCALEGDRHTYLPGHPADALPEQLASAQSRLPYNAQVAVDAHRQVIVAAEITQKTTDREQLLPMVQSVCTTTVRIAETVTADAGYWDTSSLRDPHLQGIQVLVSPDAQVQPLGAPLSLNAPKNLEAVACVKCC